MQLQQMHPVSFPQQRLWFLSQLEPASSAYNLPFAIRVTGNLHIALLRRALQAVVQRHESLRTTFIEVDGQVSALVAAEAAAVELPLVSLEHLSDDKREQQALAFASEEGRRPFDLSVGPLMRFVLLRLSPVEHIFVLNIHHIIVDGWSMSVLFREIAEFYKAFSSNRLPNIAALPIQYGDFTRWQRERITEDTLAPKLEYWRRALTGAPNALELPVDRRRPAVQTHRGCRYSINLDDNLAHDLAEFSRRERVTIFATLLAAFETLLWRYTGLADFVLGTALAGRTEVELESLVGLLVETLPLRANIEGNPTFRDLIHRVHDAALDAMAQQAPLEAIVRHLQPERDLSQTPLFQVMFILHNTPRHSMDVPGLHCEELEFDTGIAKFDLTLEIRELDGLYCAWEYSTELFDHNRVVRMTKHFETLLRGVIADPGGRLSELPILTADEKNRLLLEWNATDTDSPDDVCIHQAFEAQVAISRNTIAVHDEDREITYREINEEANCLANYLGRQGVQQRDRVGVVVERSIEAIVAVLAVLKAGASYVPIDPRYPQKRIEFMLRDSGAPVLITQHRLRNRLPKCDSRTVFVDRNRSAILAESRENLQLSLDCHDAAYVIYTSGSTGTPKGVVGTHRASMNRFAWMWNAYPFGADDICAHRTSLSFVDSIWEIFGPLLKGVPIVVVSGDTAMNSNELIRQVERQRITRIVVVPSQLADILDASAEADTTLPELQFCFASGDVLSHSLYERFAKLIPHARLINLYGSSEVAADVTCFDTAATKPHDFVPIGKPIANVRVYILDPYLKPVPIGVPGEIYVAGDCLACGYVNQPGLTAERFIADPFHPEGRMYKTGDVGRYHEDGNIEFLGRVDNQVKIRGARVELGEIESVLKEHESIRQATVIARDDRPLERALVAYVLPVSGCTVDQSELRRHLKARLPEYMVPSAYVMLEALPTTPNGKLDKHALPPPELIQCATSHEYLAPRNDLEAKLVEIFAELLKIKRISVMDNFFELGGHSLLAAQVIARIRKYLGVELPLRGIFEAPTVAELAVEVERARSEGRISGSRLTRTYEQGERAQLERRLRELSDEEIDTLLKTVRISRMGASSPE
jgi:amino acid adenylation domain-containing protein